MVAVVRFLNSMVVGDGIRVFDAYYDSHELVLDVLAVDNVVVQAELAAILGLPGTLEGSTFYVSVIDPQSFDVSWGYEIEVRGLEVSGLHDGEKNTTRVGFARRDKVVLSTPHKINTHNHGFQVLINAVRKDLVSSILSVEESEAWNVRMSIS